MKKTMVSAAAAVLLLTGCASGSSGKTPKELLALSISGLTGVDHYRFAGTAAVSVDGAEEQPVAFQGTVKDHNDIEVQTSGDKPVPGIGHPLELLKSIEASASRTELAADRSGNRTAVLHIQADEAKTGKLWADRIRGEFARLERRVPALSGLQSLSGGKGRELQAAYEREWKQELDRSRARLDGMLKTLRVNADYTLVVDRTKLLPMRLQEHAELRYFADGAERSEVRTTDMTFAAGKR
ncbi:hypothetical protein [Paenibacillus humicola]|uniref:hypothetical protein n=1 Tax=Paenibacillus humicola TaxID=3110540 RepID=UPI00237AA919|nr:hypothetical protein [Paenibacillus humicola]